MRTIIIDDEPLALRQMRSYVGRCETLTLVGAFRDTFEAEKFLRTESVDLIFSDINMPERSGIELIKALESSSPMVIFTTAHSEYAVEGFRLDAVDYLMKPLSFDDFARSVDRAHSLYTLRHSAYAPSDESDEAIIEEQYISVRADYRTVPIKISDIVYIESEGEYIRLHLVDGRKITTFYRLKNMESELPSTLFVRIHRSYIVNREAIKSYDRTRVYLSEDEYLPIGQNYRDTLSQMMEK